MKKYLALTTLLLLPAFALAETAPGANEPPVAPGDLANLDIEALLRLKIQVTTASRRAQNLSEVPAAISVLTQEDIRRSGLTSIPELLRLIPGMQVSQITANRWNVSARGFNYRFASYLQVLVDGRSVYNLDFSGVYWDSVDMVIEDIERIEVLRGPQATLWGANAVNGVINIITKHSRDTQGQLATASVGSLVKTSEAYRYGGRAADGVTYRLYGKYQENASLIDPQGNGLADDWNSRRIGVRFDGGVAGSRSGAWLATAEAYSNPTSNRVIVPRAFPTSNNTVDFHGTQSGYHILGRWETQRPNGAGTRAQVFFDHYNRQDPELGARRDKADLDVQHQFATRGQHSLIAGFGYRYNQDKTTPGFTARFDPATAADHLYSSFIQDAVTLSKKLQFIVGTQLQHNSYTGLEWLPTARLSLTPNANSAYWLAASHAVRTPSRGERGTRINQVALPGPSGSTVIVQAQGRSDVDSSRVDAYEMGMRVSRSEKVSVDVSAFYNVYRNLITIRQDAPQFISPFQPIIQPLTVINGQFGETYGAEVSSRFSVSHNWRLNLGYTYIKTDIRANKAKGGIVSTVSTPNQFQIASNLNLSRKWEIDNLLLYTDSLTDGTTPAYLRFDTRIGWHMHPNAEISLTLQNLFSGARYESRQPLGEVIVPGRVPTSVTGKVTFLW